MRTSDFNLIYGLLSFLEILVFAALVCLVCLFFIAFKRAIAESARNRKKFDEILLHSAINDAPMIARELFEKPKEENFSAWYWVMTNEIRQIHAKVQKDYEAVYDECLVYSKGRWLTDEDSADLQKRLFSLSAKLEAIDLVLDYLPKFSVHIESAFASNLEQGNIITETYGQIKSALENGEFFGDTRIDIGKVLALLEKAMSKLQNKGENANYEFVLPLLRAANLMAIPKKEKAPETP